MIKKAGIRIGKQDCRGMKRSPDEPLRKQGQRVLEAIRKYQVDLEKSGPTMA